MLKEAPKTRIDIWLAERGLVPSRQRAQALIMAGSVFCNGKPVKDRSKKVGDNDLVEVKGRDHPYVSRGGIKLMHALRSFSIDVTGRVALDVGASTGGFTDCLLQNGASKVYAVDVGYGQLDWRLRCDPRVVVIERTNVRNWDGREIIDPIDVVTIDVSFISLTKVLPSVQLVIGRGGSQTAPTLIALIKPQFEAGRSEVGKGGVVRDEVVIDRVVEKIITFVSGHGWKVIGVTPSPIKGPKGNQEYLLVASGSY